MQQEHRASLDHEALVDNAAPPHLSGMFMINEDDAAVIRAAYFDEGELSAAIELRRRFPGISDNAKAHECARTIAGWRPELRWSRPVGSPALCVEPTLLI